MSVRDDANAAYMAWLQGCDGLLSADDAAAARSEGGWLAYLAGYNAALSAAQQQPAGDKERLRVATQALRFIVELHDRGGDSQSPPWVVADDALTHMSVVDDEEIAAEARPREPRS